MHDDRVLIISGHLDSRVTDVMDANQMLQELMMMVQE
jgi:hypothetical protein